MSSLDTRIAQLKSQKTPLILKQSQPPFPGNLRKFSQQLAPFNEGISKQKQQKQLMNESHNFSRLGSFDNINKSQYQLKTEQQAKIHKIQDLMITSQTDSDHNSRGEILKKLNKKEYQDLKINIVFNQIRDLNNKSNIHDAIKLLDNKEERCLLIDKILKRKQEKQDADQILQISKVQPLVNRFMRKIKKNPPEDQGNQNQQIKSKENIDLDKSLIQSQMDIKSNQNDQLINYDHNHNHANTNQNPIINLSSEDKQSIDNSSEENNNNNNNNNSLNKNQGKNLNKKQEPSLGNKVIILSLFAGDKKKDDSSSQSKLSNISAYKEQYQKISQTGKKINLNKVSENSMELINKGRQQTKQKVNELLKDVQKQSLAAHFKSFSFKNKFETKSSQSSHTQEINTFHTEIAEQQMKKQQEKMMNYINYQNQLGAAKVVTNEVINYIGKFKKDPDNFLIYPKIILEPQVRSIENQVTRNVSEKSKSVKNVAAISKKDYQPSTWRQKSSSAFMLNRQASLSHLFSSSRQSSPLNSKQVEYPPYFTSRQRATQNELLDCYARRKSDATSRSCRGRSPINFTKGFQSSFSKECLTPKSPSPQIMMDSVINVSSPKQLSTQAGTTTTNRSFVRTSEQNYTSHRNRIDITKKTYFSYQNDLFYLFNITGNQDEKDILSTNEENDAKKEDYMRTFDNKQMNLKIKNVQTVNKWKLDGSIHFTGEDKQIFILLFYVLFYECKFKLTFCRKGVTLTLQFSYYKIIFNLLSVKLVNQV